jgi:all-trans-retinol 13,14-reductase
MERDLWDVRPDTAPGPADVLYCSFPSLKDPSHDPGPLLRHTGEVITFVPWEGFQKWSGTRWQKRGDEYEEFKEMISSKLLAQYLGHFPELTNLVKYKELSTPLSTKHFARSHRGSIYGLASEPGRFTNEALSPKTPIKNLYLAGVDVMAPGIAGAVGGGALAVASAKPAESARFLRPIVRSG